MWWVGGFVLVFVFVLASVFFFVFVVRGRERVWWVGGWL